MEKGERKNMHYTHKYALFYMWLKHEIKQKLKNVLKGVQVHLILKEH